MRVAGRILVDREQARHAGAALIFRAHGMTRALGRDHQHIEIGPGSIRLKCTLRPRANISADKKVILRRPGGERRTKSYADWDSIRSLTLAWRGFPGRRDRAAVHPLSDSCRASYNE